MSQIQVSVIPETQRAFLVQLNRDFRAALSYVSFYSTDSPFVVQALQKLHKDFQKILQTVTPVVFYFENGVLRLNDMDFSECNDLIKALQEKDIPGFKITAGLSQAELTPFLRRLTLPFAEPESEVEKGHSHIQILSTEDQMILPAAEAGMDFSAEASSPAPVEVPPAFTAPAPFTFPDFKPNEPVPAPEASPSRRRNQDKTNEALLIFVAEAWQFSQLQRKHIGAAPEMPALTQAFDRLFDRLLERMEKTTPGFKEIYQWFKSPSGQLLEDQAVIAMFPLLEVAVKNNMTEVFFDPATEGLVGECLAHWGANGQHDLVEKSVTCLAESLKGDILERQIALTHLMDARPWVRNPELLEKVLTELNTMLAKETYPALYQSALLLAWDLIEPAIEVGKEQPVLTLLSTLHFHADEDIAAFPERFGIARHWLFERSTPELIRLFVSLAINAGQLTHYPLLGEMAAPILLDDFLASPATAQSNYYPLFREIKEHTRSALAEWLADLQEEGPVHQVLPILRVCGFDAGLSLLVSAWLSRGSRELKLNLIGLIEEVNDAAAGPALRLAVFDDSEEVAAMAARVIGKIRFFPGLKVLLKAAKIREARFPENELFLTSLCQALGDLGQEESLAFLLDIARKKPLLRGKHFPLEVRLEAIQALTKLKSPEAWHFVESLMEEKNPVLQEALEKIIEERTGPLS